MNQWEEARAMRLRHALLRPLPGSTLTVYIDYVLRGKHAVAFASSAAPLEVCRYKSADRYSRISAFLADTGTV